LSSMFSLEGKEEKVKEKGVRRFPTEVTEISIGYLAVGTPGIILEEYPLMNAGSAHLVGPL